MIHIWECPKMSLTRQFASTIRMLASAVAAVSGRQMDWRILSVDEHGNTAMEYDSLGCRVQVTVLLDKVIVEAAETHEFSYDPTQIPEVLKKIIRVLPPPF
jgi:YD repeat-containing protein